MRHPPMRTIEFIQREISTDPKQPGRESGVGRIAFPGSMNSNEGLLQ
jgi:hypothetical protein